MWEGNSSEADKVEVVMNDMLRMLSRCNRKTNLWALRMEFGMHSLQHQRKRAKLFQVGRALTFPDNRLAKTAAKMPSSAKKTPRQGLRHHVAGAVSAWQLEQAHEALRGGGSCRAWESAVVLASEKAEREEFEKEATRPRSQLRVLSHIKKQPRLEEWLAKPALKPVDYLRLRLRSGVHGLAASKKQRGEDASGLCACGEEEETVVHFLLKCSLYQEERKRFEVELGALTVGSIYYHQREQEEGKAAFLLSATGGSLSESRRVDSDLNAVLERHLEALWKARCEKLTSVSSQGTKSVPALRGSIRGYFAPVQVGQVHTPVLLSVFPAPKAGGANGIHSMVELN